MATVNKVRLDEILDGTMLLKWVDQPVFDRTASTSASAYLVSLFSAVCLGGGGERQKTFCALENLCALS